MGLDLLVRRFGDSGRVHGVDRSTTMLAAAARRFRSQVASGRLALHEASIEHLPLESSTLDGAITLNTLYFISDLKGALAECARVLRPSGQLVIGIGDPDVMARQRITSYGFQVRPWPRSPRRCWPPASRWISTSASAPARTSSTSCWPSPSSVRPCHPCQNVWGQVVPSVLDSCAPGLMRAVPDLYPAMDGNLRAPESFC